MMNVAVFLPAIFLFVISPSLGFRLCGTRPWLAPKRTSAMLELRSHGLICVLRESRRSRCVFTCSHKEQGAQNGRERREGGK
mmetsp:Transcript_33806/g.106053  ORF Transcript_33806/g.106053 Transcript_33806/m.106053 type:complete len:82 (-) Transcript_33806:313-558(-)